MRTTVTVESSDIERLMAEMKFKSKAKAVAYALRQTLRLRNLEVLEAARGTVKINQRVLRDRHRPR